MGALSNEFISKNYNYYLYKASITLARTFNSDKQNLHFLIALRYYDKYLRRKFGLAISNLQNIFNQFILKNGTEKEDILKSLVGSEDDTLIPIRIFTTRLNNDENILTEDSYVEKLKKTVNFLIPIVAILVTIIQLLISRQ